MFKCNGNNAEEEVRLKEWVSENEGRDGVGSVGRRVLHSWWEDAYLGISKAVIVGMYRCR